MDTVTDPFLEVPYVGHIRGFGEVGWGWEWSSLDRAAAWLVVVLLFHGADVQGSVVVWCTVLLVLVISGGAKSKLPSFDVLYGGFQFVELRGSGV